MSQDDMTETNYDDVQFFDPDYSLSKRIGAPLQEVFTQDRVHKAQDALRQTEAVFKGEAMQQVRELREMCAEPDQSVGAGQKLLHMRQLAMKLKGTSGIAGYPYAVKLSGLMVGFLDNVTVLDEHASQLCLTIVRAIAAIFSEERRSEADETSQQVLEQLMEHVGAYQAR